MFFHRENTLHLKLWKYYGNDLHSVLMGFDTECYKDMNSFDTAATAVTNFLHLINIKLCMVSPVVFVIFIIEKKEGVVETQ